LTKNHFGGILPSQSFGLVLYKKSKQHTRNQTWLETLAEILNVTQNPKP